MAIFKLMLCAGWLISLQVFSGTPVLDKKETINGVVVQTGKQDSTRIYQGSVTKTFPYKLETIKKSVINFHEKCNNSLKDRRKYTDKKADCKYHNENMVETLVIKDIKQTGWTKAPGEVERFVLGRLIYNRGAFGYYELVQVFYGKNKKNQNTIKIVQTMLDDKVAKIYISPAFDKDSAFDTTQCTFTLTELSPTETKLRYKYRANTEHWILNKEVSVPQVFASMSKSINDLVKTVDTESIIQSRDLASN
jgi:hypothetical protein